MVIELDNFGEIMTASGETFEDCLFDKSVKMTGLERIKGINR